MSLRVWLPLNGNLNNQGLSNITVTNNGATINNSGKIGKCYNFNNSAIGIITNNSITLGTTFSITCWIKINSYNQDWANAFKIYKDGYDYIGLCMNQANATTKQLGFHIYKNNGSNTRTGVTDGYYMPLTVGKWYHLCFIVTPTQVTTYQDGIKIKTNNITVNFPSIINYNLSLGKSSLFSGLDCSINDFRLYDHALSAKEVEEIAKGLVLHYKLDNNGLGNINLVTGSNTSSTSTNKWVGHSAVGGNISTIELDETGIYCVKITRDNTAQSSWDFVSYDNLLRNAIKPATIYTVSFDCKPSVNGSMGLTGFAQGNATNYMTNSTTTIQGTCIANQWNHMIYQCKTINSFDNITIGSQVVYFSRSASLKGTNVTVLFKNIKVEEGSVATPWVPATSDVIYSQFIGDTNIIYDSSGYNNNGTIIGSLETVSDSSRYSCAMKFDGNTSGILIENLQLSNIINTAITYSFWIKPKGENGARSIYFGSYSSTSWSIEKTTGNKLRLYWNGSPDETSSAVITDGEWQHIVITKNGTNDIKVYLNGELTWTSTATHNNLTFPTTYRIGRDTRSGDGTPYNGQMSDFRIYATALTEAQVKELYNTSMSIDDKGNIHARELIVEDTNNISTNKRGQLLVNTAEEDAAIASFIKPNKIECDNFYEY